MAEENKARIQAIKDSEYPAYGYCLCTHGWGQHQGGRCLNSECECRKWIKVRDRWAPRSFDGRKYCWFGVNGRPICGKKVDVPNSSRFIYSGDLAISMRCVGCQRWVEAHPLAVDPRVSLREVEEIEVTV